METKTKKQGESKENSVNTSLNANSNNQNQSTQATQEKKEDKKEEKNENTTQSSETKETKLLPLETPEQMQKKYFALLEDEMKRYQEKNKLIFNRNKFILTADNLEKIKTSNFQNMDDFDDHNNLKLKFVSGNYRDNEEIAISNVFIIKEFLDFIKGKIQIKINDLEKQILS